MFIRDAVFIAGFALVTSANSCIRSQPPTPTSLRAGAGLTRGSISDASGRAELKTIAYFDTTTAWVNGIVTDSITQDAIPKVSIILLHLSSNRLEKAVSDEQGRFVFRHILGSDWRMTVQAPQYKRYELDTLQLGGAEFDLRIKLIKRELN